MKRTLPLLLVLALASPSLGAAEVAAPVIAKFIKILLSSTAAPKVDCQEPEVAAELFKLNVTRDADARIAWTTKDVARLSKAGKLVVCGSKDLLDQGAGLAIVAEDGRPVIYINLANVAASKVSIPESVLKIAKAKR